MWRDRMTSWWSDTVETVWWQVETWLDVENVKRDVSGLGEVESDDEIRCDVMGQGVMWCNVMESGVAWCDVSGQAVTWYNKVVSQGEVNQNWTWSGQGKAWQDLVILMRQGVITYVLTR